MTIEQLDAMYKKSYALALAKRNPSAMVAAVSALAKSQRQHTPHKFEKRLNYLGHAVYALADCNDLRPPTP